MIACNTAFTYKGKAVDVKQVGRDLGVHCVLEGSVRRAGEQVRVNVQLIDADSSTHAWADRFDPIAPTLRQLRTRWVLLYIERWLKAQCKWRTAMSCHARRGRRRAE